MSIYENKKLSVYLAGGMRGDWQERVIKSAGHDSFNFINPKKNGSKVFEVVQKNVWSIKNEKTIRFWHDNAGGHLLAGLTCCRPEYNPYR